ncbi:unnamed protein product [Pleuronectes platessa]|uniref:Uncharacterized protein n=1 Tax=Pleuronectes platessa TaxID=8262 RepID=A0A9N7TN43_PLEPL|nr:unnamed protein product [Pleuronectes platessa]
MAERPRTGVLLDRCQELKSMGRGLASRGAPPVGNFEFREGVVGRVEGGREGGEGGHPETPGNRCLKFNRVTEGRATELHPTARLTISHLARLGAQERRKGGRCPRRRQGRFSGRFKPRALDPEEDKEDGEERGKAGKRKERRRERRGERGERERKERTEEGRGTVGALRSYGAGLAMPSELGGEITAVWTGAAWGAFVVAGARTAGAGRPND